MTTTRPLYAIADDIRRDWHPIAPAARPYVDALGMLDTVDGRYGFDDGRTIVAYFLSNASTWRGETARTVKAELRAITR